MKTISFAVNNPEEIKIKLDKQISTGFSPTLAFVFASVKPDIHITSQAFKDYPFPVFGCSTGGNIVYSIDDEPALEIYKKYLDVKDADLPAIGVEYPLLIKHNNTFSLRAVMGVDRENQALIFAGTVPQDSIVTFSSSPGFEVMDSTKEKINEFYEEHQDADMLLLFSCMARYLALGPVITEEINFSAEKWGIPVSGFFTYGEIGTNVGTRCDFFNQTYTFVILKEK